VVDLDGQRDLPAEVLGQCCTDRLPQRAFDGVLGEVAGCGEQRGAIQQADRAGDAHPGALLRRERSARKLPDDLVPDLAEIGLPL
jgi:hypothetical protein